MCLHFKVATLLGPSRVRAGGGRALSNGSLPTRTEVNFRPASDPEGLEQSAGAAGTTKPSSLVFEDYFLFYYFL